MIVISEYVSDGHPDKIADTIADKLVEKYVELDKNSRCGIEVMVKDNIVVLGGEVNSSANVDYDKIVRSVFERLHFPSNHNLSSSDIKIINLIGKQSPEIHGGVDKNNDSIGAGDQGFMVGYANNETPTYMPLGHYIAKKICVFVSSYDRGDVFGPDTKSQVVVNYVNKDDVRIESILVSTMSQIPLEETRDIITRMIVLNKIGLPLDIFNKYIKDKNIKIDINPCGEWKIGGSVSDCGITGRKIVVDQYGGYCNVGGGAFSGKDLTKVDRSGAYMCRYLAKNIVACGIANIAKVELGYMIGVEEPCAFNIVLDTDVDIDRLKKEICSKVDLRPKAIMERFNYDKLVYSFSAINGHFGYNEEIKSILEIAYPWEKLDLNISI